jgi:hypothetical protein
MLEKVMDAMKEKMPEDKMANDMDSLKSIMAELDALKAKVEALMEGESSVEEELEQPEMDESEDSEEMGDKKSPNVALIIAAMKKKRAMKEY